MILRRKNPINGSLFMQLSVVQQWAPLPHLYPHGFSRNGEKKFNPYK
ncbi:hypothetical protein HCH_03742 [Hahella chejuensis KCTC 2396]|uniref:Uncharacterized protein n=1 Tax=Hahella chejuensis (strain KCTC 2396) TaxID=349521 RepID=Q2SFU8_HAHCH|nr:hypothetical protein HCH_03742 [Hahella chejuensis KCTC 2396]